MDSDCGPECEEALREIERFLDDELDPAVRASVGRHLASCSPCTQRADFRRHLKELIASRCGHDAVPADLLPRIKALIETQRPLHG